jgi:hypothetical protein
MKGCMTERKGCEERASEKRSGSVKKGGSVKKREGVIRVECDEKASVIWSP